MKKKLLIGIATVVLVAAIIAGFFLFNRECHFKDGFVNLPERSDLSGTQLTELEDLINKNDRIRIGDFKGIGNLEYEIICHDEGVFYGITVTPEIVIIQSNRFPIHYRVITDKNAIDRLKELIGGQ